MFLLSFRERGREREILISCLANATRQGIKPITQVCALTGNQTHNLLVYEMTLQLSHPARALSTFIQIICLILQPPPRVFIPISVQYRTPNNQDLYPNSLIHCWSFSTRPFMASLYSFCLDILR